MIKINVVRQYLFGIILLVVIGFAGYRTGVYETSRQYQGGEMVDTRVMNEVLVQLKKNYLKPEDIDSNKLMYGAVEGMTASLGDPYTSFFPPEENARSKEDLQGEFGGVGIQLGFIDNTLAVMTPLKDTPAFKAGIKAGDFILKIVDEKKKISKDTSGMKVEDAVDLIRGEKGTPVILTIFRESEKKSREVTLMRDVINVPSTELEWLDSGKVALIRVNKFGEKTLPEWEKMVSEVKNKNIKGIILDLRNNPGGYLQRAIDLGSEFIADGVIVKQKDRNRTEVSNVDREGKLIGMPLVVLVNGGSASAAEILAGALRERLGTKLVGEKSFGKGTVQEPEDFNDGSSLHVTIAEWLLPSGKNIHKIGLEPDVKIEYIRDEKNPTADNQVDKALEVLKGEMSGKTVIGAR
ncbi:peptidase S41 [Candidatus Collierbacteria bacterium CG_4_10_14_0_8_um_filter_43_86]|uniref:Peptidase S41 n=1 Tax=Candidatus Collierbacteria bacterium CG_4_9_14_3_um_filter_43_16 TaxID=1974532 RepID=A0A2M8BYA2_9BACT|nr:MAG: peptidase S41 [Candidatus Collierbacteria bacterium CG_4_10_14_0_8_um_filter_43_86]PJB48835.1 MAG: peptidase S41 [Candidatus Collierbacteria bacterium CG_4_9_14_3_um_filter_43_16]